MLESIFQNPLKQPLVKYNEIVKKINDREKEMEALNDIQLKEYAEKLKSGSEGKKADDSTIIKAFSLVREATKRVLNIRHFDVQLIGGLVLHDGKIAEMKTGEGKTIVALLPTFLKALEGKGAHVITVNDYLAKRDAEYVGRIHNFLGLTVGLIQENMEPEERQRNYNCDVVYVTNNELGFDYLRDNMASIKEEVVQRPFYYGIIDEVDSILIDEARTPLIISGPSEVTVQKYTQATKLATTLQRDLHYLVDEKNQNVTLSEEGSSFCEKVIGTLDLYNVNDPWIFFILNSLKAKELFKRNTHYIVNEENEIIIVDEFTGRTMFGRRWSDGLHQAVEAKENVPIQNEMQTLASITYQNLFLLYDKIAGMSGTVKTEEIEFERIYNLSVVSIPTNLPVKRKDFSDLVYKNQYLKWQAVANECIEMNRIKRPILIGTTTIENSELLAALLNEYNIPYRLLNAKPENIEQEAEIVAQAGCSSAVTISTNMAGRGTDITLGGNSEALINTKLKRVIKELSINDNLLNFNDPELQKISFLLNDPEYKKWYSDKKNLDLLLDFLNEKNGDGNFYIKKFAKVYEEIIKISKQNELLEKERIINLGGLHVIGTERHESRRIDNQLRGRSGRQGDPGSSRFFLSLDDKLLRLFGGDKILDFIQNIGLEDDTPIQSPILTKSLESAQKKVEAYYYESRKQLFEYDQALNLQRNGIYSERKKILQTINLREWILEYGERSIYDLLTTANSKKYNNLDSFVQIKMKKLLGLYYSSDFNAVFEDQNLPLTKKLFKQQFQISYDLKEMQLEIIEPGLVRELERSFILQQIDFSWKDHLKKISSLRESIRWRAYGQRDPLTDYKKESYNFFIIMLTQIRHRIVYLLLRSKIIIDFKN